MRNGLGRYALLIDPVDERRTFSRFTCTSLMLSGLWGPRKIRSWSELITSSYDFVRRRPDCESEPLQCEKSESEARVESRVEGHEARVEVSGEGRGERR